MQTNNYSPQAPISQDCESPDVDVAVDEIEGAVDSPSLWASAVVPIRSLSARHRERVEQHLLELQAQDRYLRFGYAAQDEQVRAYVASIDFERDDVFGIYNRKIELIAMAHLAYATDKELAQCAEFGVSVSAHARARGYGGRLFDRAAMHARNKGVSMMFIHALSENEAMLKIARKAGATVERDGSDSEAHLLLPHATLDSQITEIVEEQLAQTDYRIKVQSKQFWEFLNELQHLRRSSRAQTPADPVTATDPANQATA